MDRKDINMVPSALLFSMAARELVKDKKRRKEARVKDIAKKMGVKSNYLSALLTGNRNWSDPIKDKFALAVGRSVPEIYHIGEGIQEGSLFHLYEKEFKDIPPHSPLRALKLVKIASEELKLIDIGLLRVEVLESWAPSFFQKYKDKKLTDIEFYEEAKNAWLKLLKKYL